MPAKPADLSGWKNVLKHPKRGVPEGLWKRCPGCQATIFRKEAEKRLGVCPECDYHWYVPARQRIAQVLDEGTFEEWDADLESADPLEFVDKMPYPQRLAGGAAANRAARGGRDGGGHDPRPPRRLRRDRFRLHHGQHGLGRRRKAHPRHRTRHRPAIAADHRLRLGRRRQDARRAALADADGQGLRGAGPARRCRRAVHLGVDQSDDGRRGGELRLVGRRRLRRAPRPDRLRRPDEPSRPRSASSCPRASRPASSSWSTASSTASSAAKTCKANWPEPSTTAENSGEQWAVGSAKLQAVFHLLQPTADCPLSHVICSTTSKRSSPAAGT